MTTDLFDAATTSTGGLITDYEGALLLITPTEYRPEVNTTRGPTDAVVVDFTVLDGARAGETATGSLIFPKVLKGALKSKVGTGRMVLGRLGKGVAKPGQSAPWVLGEPTEQDKQTARDHLSKTVQPPF